MKTNRNETNAERREHGANDIIFIFVNEFRTKNKFLTSAGIFFLFFSFFCSTIEVAVHEIADGGMWGPGREGNKRRLRKKLNRKSNKIMKSNFAWFPFKSFFSRLVFKWKWEFIALLLNHQAETTHRRSFVRSHMARSGKQIARDRDLNLFVIWFCI